MPKYFIGDNMNDIKIIINENTYTLEEARDLYNQLKSLFDNPFYIWPSSDYSDLSNGAITPIYSSDTCDQKE